MRNIYCGTAALSLCAWHGSQRSTSVWPQYKGFRKLILDHEMKFEIGFDVLDSTTTMMILRSRQERETHSVNERRTQLVVVEPESRDIEPKKESNRFERHLTYVICTINLKVE